MFRKITFGKTYNKKKYEDHDRKLLLKISSDIIFVTLTHHISINIMSACSFMHDRFLREAILLNSSFKNFTGIFKK